MIALLYSASFVLARPALAQSDVGSPLGSLYLSPLPTAYQPVMVDIPPFVPQSSYLVVDIDFDDDSDDGVSTDQRSWTLIKLSYRR